MELSSSLSPSSGNDNAGSLLPLLDNITALILMVKDLGDADRAYVYQTMNASQRMDLICSLSRHSVYPPSFQSVVSVHCTGDQPTVSTPAPGIERQLLIYAAPVLLLTGTVGNALSFAVLAKTGVHLVSTYCYLVALSIADTLVLLVGLLPIWIDALTGCYVRELTDWTCKLTSVVGLTVSDYSVWLIVALTADRYVAVCHPLRALRLCHAAKAFRLIVGLFVLLLAFNVHSLWTTEIHTFNHTNRCEPATGYEPFALGVWPWLDACVYCFLPFSVILVLNALIVRAVVRAGARRHALGHSRPSPYDEHRRSESSASSGVESNARLTIMLLMISMTFLVTTLPMNVILIVTTFRKSTAKDQVEATKFRLARTIAELLMYANHSMNFFLYCAAGRKFRSQLLKIVCPEGQKPCKMDTMTIRNGEFTQPERVCILLTELKGGKPRSTVTAIPQDNPSATVLCNSDYREIS